MTTPEVHHCHAGGCSVPIEPERFMCAWHWTRLTAGHRMAILNTYRPGQKIDKQPGVAYMAAARAAIDWIAANEAPGARWDE